MTELFEPTSGTIEIGSCTTHHDIATSALLHQQAPVIAEAAAAIGDPQVRHRAEAYGLGSPA